MPQTAAPGKPLAGDRPGGRAWHDQIFSADAFASGEPVGSLSDWITSIGRQLVGCADHWATAAMYEHILKTVAGFARIA